LNFFFGLLSLMLIAACSSQVPGATPVSLSTPSSVTVAPSEWPTSLRAVIGDRHAPTDDNFEVFVCAVPLDTSDAIYGRLTQRLQLTPDQLATKLNNTVTPYFEALSHGLYHPRFSVGSTLAMTADETHDQCVERAIDASGADVGAVMVVADAEHLSTEPGGWGRAGTACDAVFCPASQTRRALYVGASDFHADWGPTPAVDLTEHEIGHTLGLPHSGDPTSADQHDSALDVMSNSAAPRDTQPERRNGQDTLAINRLALGWLAAADVVVSGGEGGTFTLAPSTGGTRATGARLLVLPVTDDSFLTVEYLTADGFDDFLPASGLAVHKIDQSGSQRQQTTLGSPPPHLQLLSKVGTTWSVNGWTIALRSSGSTVQVEVRPNHG
jgi:hypothetical protein